MYMGRRWPTLMCTRTELSLSARSTSTTRSLLVRCHNVAVTRCARAISSRCGWIRRT
ncbi:Uncharacterised protein [Bordetella pertussis]|nr:Uncharacterised protein [Bordetella pertussis]CPI81413.1 Uncharacterised protein [Bordetella pertussis]